jgi:hypothetical protein
MGAIASTAQYGKETAPVVGIEGTLARALLAAFRLTSQVVQVADKRPKNVGNGEREHSDGRKQQRIPSAVMILLGISQTPAE